MVFFIHSQIYNVMYAGERVLSKEGMRFWSGTIESLAKPAVSCFY
jgi:hypothetical protein